MPEIFRRCPDNPLIRQEDLPFAVSAVYNPGVAEHNGEVVLLVRIEDRKGLSNIHVARSANGVSGWNVEEKPILAYGEKDMRYETLGCEDARVTYMKDREKYFITFVAYSELGSAVGLAETEDFGEAKRLGLLFPPNNKDAVIFPEKIDGKYWVLHRPAAGEMHHIWSSCSPDLIHWGMPHCVVPERGNAWWDGVKVGAGCPPIRTDDGWLLVYHGVKEFGGNMVYRAGFALLDLERPHRVLARTSGWVFGPEAPYEHTGILPNVIFPCGSILRGDELWMYYGAADTAVCLATARMSDIMALLEEERQEPCGC